MKRLILLILALATCESLATLTVTTVPTFENVGYYVPYASDAGVVCKVYYKATSSPTWKQAYTPIFGNSYVYGENTNTGDPEFRGSIVGLSENTSYNLWVVILTGTDTTEQGTATFTTWNPSPTIARTHAIGDLYSSGALILADTVGTANGWIRIVGDGTTVIEADTSLESAVKITGCQYLILEKLTIRGGRNGIIIGPAYGEASEMCSNVRIINCDISGWGRVAVEQIGGVWYDKDGVNRDGEAGIFIGYSTKTVVERCYIHDPQGRTNTWDGPGWSTVHPVGPTAIAPKQAENSVIRYNDMTGSRIHSYNDNIQCFYNGLGYGGLYRDTDVYGNLFAFSNDDGVEFERTAMNLRGYKNKFTMMFGGVGLNPNTGGPMYIFRNVFTHSADATGYYNFSAKMGGGGAGRAFFFHNTAYVQGSVMVPSSETSYRATVRNNILHSTGNGAVFDASTDASLATSDYDLWYGRVLPDYPDNEANGVEARATFTDSAANNFSLQAGSAGLNIGTVLDNFSDGYASTAPDAGAFEYGANGMSPYRPINITASKYRVTGSSGTTVTLTSGSIDSTWHFTVHKYTGNSWLTVTPTTGSIATSSTATLTFSSTDADSEDVVSVRFANGYSIPITVDHFVGDAPDPPAATTRRVRMRIIP